jgi:hypothetical protein
MISGADPFRRSPTVLWRRSLDAVVVLPTGADEPITLGGTGIAVWELLDTWRSVDALTEMLAPRYDADPAVVAADVSTLVDLLEGVGALEVAADSGHPPKG